MKQFYISFNVDGDSVHSLKLEQRGGELIEHEPSEYIYPPFQFREPGETARTVFNTLLDLLSTHQRPIRRAEIIDACDQLTTPQVDAALQELLACNDIERVSRGHYQSLGWEPAEY